MKKLRETLNELYIHLDSAAALGGSEDLPTGLAGFGQGEYFPYVYYKINIDMVGPSSSNIWTLITKKVFDICDYLSNYYAFCIVRYLFSLKDNCQIIINQLSG